MSYMYHTVVVWNDEQNTPFLESQYSGARNYRKIVITQASEILPYDPNYPVLYLVSTADWPNIASWFSTAGVAYEVRANTPHEIDLTDPANVEVIEGLSGASLSASAVAVTAYDPLSPVAYRAGELVSMAEDTSTNTYGISDSASIGWTSGGPEDWGDNQTHLVGTDLFRIRVDSAGSTQLVHTDISDPINPVTQVISGPDFSLLLNSPDYCMACIGPVVDDQGVYSDREFIVAVSGYNNGSNSGFFAVKCLWAGILGLGSTVEFGKVTKKKTLVLAVAYDSTDDVLHSVYTFDDDFIYNDGNTNPWGGNTLTYSQTMKGYSDIENGNKRVGAFTIRLYQPINGTTRHIITGGYFESTGVIIGNLTYRETATIASKEEISFPIQTWSPGTELNFGSICYQESQDRYHIVFLAEAFPMTMFSYTAGGLVDSPQIDIVDISTSPIDAVAGAVQAIDNEVFLAALDSENNAWLVKIADQNGDHVQAEIASVTGQAPGIAEVVFESMALYPVSEGVVGVSYSDVTTVEALISIIDVSSQLSLVRDKIGVISSNKDSADPSIAGDWRICHQGEVAAIRTDEILDPTTGLNDPVVAGQSIYFDLSTKKPVTAAGPNRPLIGKAVSPSAMLVL
uniref:Uncharacterized protein n=1 Tax=viral metagenome TaxID=1070528 RepID=A0A2V0RA94_9ZZZZ